LLREPFHGYIIKRTINELETVAISQSPLRSLRN